jgi:hypothetical protein
METTQDTPLSAPDLASLDVETLRLRVTQLTDGLQAAHQRENALRDELTVNREQLSNLRNNVRSDCTLLSEELITQANNRGWCSIYDEIVETLNSQFAVLAIDEREGDHEIEVEVTATYEFHTMVTVRARSMDDAIDILRNDPESYIDSDQLREHIQYNYDTPSNVDVEVV